MVIQRTRFVVLLVLCPLLVPPAAAQNEEGFKGRPMDFLPLQVGNQWTYQHWYVNNLYNRFEIVEGVVKQYGARAILEYDPLSFQWMRIRMIAEIHGYPLTARYEWESPLFDLLYSYTDLTIEITHTETIEGHTYFVFSEPSYDWPPVPTLFLAGQKVRFSDAGVLLIRRQEQDIPLYDFAPPYIEKDYTSDKDYTTPEYPLLYDAHAPVSLPLVIHRHFRDASLRRNWPWGYNPPTISGPVFSTIFAVFTKDHWFGSVYFLANYGLALYEVWKPEFDRNRFFENSLFPVSAVIDGKEIKYLHDNTHVQPTSWGQLKARHRQ